MLLAFGLEDIGATFQEEHPEDVILVGGGIEALLPQPVGGGVEVAFEFGEREAWHGSVGKGEVQTAEAIGFVSFLDAVAEGVEAGLFRHGEVLDEVFAQPLGGPDAERLQTVSWSATPESTALAPPHLDPLPAHRLERLAERALDQVAFPLDCAHSVYASASCLRMKSPSRGTAKE